MSEPKESPYLRAAFLAGPLATAIGVLVALVAVLAAGATAGSLTEALRVAVRAWLIAIGSGLQVGSTDITLVPIGAWALVAVLVAWTTRWVLADPVDALPAFVASTGGSVGLLAALGAAAASAGDTEIGLIRAAVAGFVVGAAGAAIGAVSKHGRGADLWFTVSENLRRAVRDAVPAVAAMLIASTVIVVVLLFRNRDRAADLWALIDPGLGGGLVLALACLLALPTAVLWTGAALLGPGFSVGTQTSVDLTGAQLGAVPGFPVLAALPAPGEFSGWVFWLGLVPVLSGAIAGWRADTRGRPGLTARLVGGAAAGAVAGFLIGVLVGASGGSIGPGRMVEAGPPALTPLLFGVLSIGLGGAIGAALAHYRDLRASAVPDDEPSGDGTGPARRPRLRWRHHPAGPDRGDGPA